MDDYIKRKDAIEALGEEPYVWSDTDAEIAEHAQWVSDVKAIEAVPAADVAERKYGKWDKDSDMAFYWSIPVLEIRGVYGKRQSELLPKLWC